MPKPTMLQQGSCPDTYVACGSTKRMLYRIPALAAKLKTERPASQQEWGNRENPASFYGTTPTGGNGLVRLQSGALASRSFVHL